jgi:signal transduction histidine kinase
MINILSLPITNTFEGVLLFIIALAAFLFLIPLKDKTKATWLLSAFFICMALLGFARILEGTVGGTLFVLLQDAFIILGGLFLVQFAYHLPQYDQPREARIALLVYSLITLLAFGTILILGIEAYRNPEEFISTPEYYWYLMPLAILLAIVLCLRRALHYAGHSKQSEASWHARLSQSFGALLHPPNDNIAVQRNLALAISLGMIQALPSMGLVTGVWGSYMIGIGGLLVVGGIALVHYSHTLEPISFTAKLVGVSLTGLLIFSGISGISSIETELAVQDQPIFAQFEAVQEAIISSGEAPQPPLSLVGFIVSWPYPTDYQLADLQIHFLGDDIIADSLNSIQGLGGPVNGLKAGAAGQFAGVHYTDFYRIRFAHAGRVYEIGFPWLEYAQPVLAEVNKHIFLTVMGTLFVLILFPLFFRRHLFNPLSNLLQGLRRVEKGQLETAIPIFFEDEIGSITHSFNQLMASLRLSNSRRDEYYAELKSANEEMELRVAERTQELTEINRQLQIAKDEAEQTAVLEERQRLARDLHDAITQSLYGVMLFARASRDAQMRLLLHQLRPLSLEHGGLPRAIIRRFNQVERRLGITATAEIKDDLGLSRTVEESLYFFTIEALNNSLKHGNAKKVSVSLGQDNGDVQLIVEDNGQGFDQSKPAAGLGLNNMQERADLLGGEIEIWSEEGKGTRVRLSLPQSMKRE